MTNKEIAMKAMQELFVKRNISALNQYWKEPYVQHNPNMASGLDGIRSVLPYVPDNFSYQPGIVVSEGNIVIAHSRVIGWGSVPQIIVDIFRLDDGKIVEHWDVIQDEVESGKSQSGNAMTSYNVARHNMNSITLRGNRFLADVGPLSIDLAFNNDDTVTFTVTKGGGLVSDGHTETHPVNPIEVRKNVFFLSWSENSGATVTHLEDYNLEKLHTHITMPDGTFIPMLGKISPVTTDSIITAAFPVKDTPEGKVIKQIYDDAVIEFTFKKGGNLVINPLSGNYLGVYSRTVESNCHAITEDCYLISWQDRDKTSVVQIIDLVSKTIISNVTFPGSPLAQKIGRTGD